MNLSVLCIKRPVFTIVLSLVIMSLGAVFFNKLQVRGTPNISPAIITVNSYYDGADALYMEKQITAPIEKALKTLKNLKSMSSSSSVSQSNIMLEFELDTDIEVALNDVRSMMPPANYFPDDMGAPSISKMDSDSWPTLWISVTSSMHDDLELTRIVNNQIKAPLEKLSTVGKSRIYGGSYYSMHIEPINTKMFQHKLTPIDLEAAIRSQNKDYPAGSIKTDSRSFSLKLAGSLNKPEEFEDIIVKKYPDGTIIKLKDVAHVRLKPYESDMSMRYNGNQSLAIGLIKQSTANIIELSESVIAELPKIVKTLPPSVKIEIAFDGAVSVKASIRAVYFTIFEAVLLVGFVIYLFLGSLRITMIPLVTIPISLIGTFSAMYMLGFTINTFTLLAMILAVGLVVDDAIVMLENIFRHSHELGKPPMVAAIDASKEISFAVVAMTMTLAAVFLPIGLIDGFLGKLFVEFAWTLAFCVLFSGFVALTLTPMMTSRMIKQETSPKLKFLQSFDSYLLRVQDGYIGGLIYAMANKKKFYAVCAGSIVALIASFVYIDKTFVPKEDQGYLIVSFKGVEGASTQESLKTIIEAEKTFSKYEDIQGFLTIAGDGSGDQGFAFVPLNDWSTRSNSQDELADKLNKDFAKIPGMSIFAISPQPFGGGGSNSPVNFILQTSLEYSDLDQVAQKFVDQMKENKMFENISKDFKASTPTLDIVVNREKAYRYGVDIDTIGKTVQYLIAGKNVGDFRMGNDIYNVVLRYNKKDRNNPSDLNKIYVKTKDNELLPLETVASLIETITVKTYKHYNNSKAIRITSDMSKDTSLGDAAKIIEEMAENIIDPNTTQLKFSGQIQQMNESGGDTLITFLFALLFIYLILSAQFESFSDSLLILLAVPFSMTGGVLTLLIFGDSINMYSNIGLITLIGLVTKNSIMLVEFTNQLRETGKNIHDAVIEAAKLRLRPILMTSIATICGAIPLAFASGAGAASRSSIGLVVVGGMLVGTLFTIFVIPLLYETFKKEKDLREERSLGEGNS
ncbi:MAG: hydrogenase expression protein HypA [Rickettsiales bacterium]|nr:MAG: hydrogenase expression protein HypA [Rickettsiales bacterium]